MKHPFAPFRRTLIGKSRILGAVLLLGLLCAPRVGSAQEPRDSLAAEVARLAALVDSLAREVARLRAAGQPVAADSAQNALARLRAAADSAAAAQPGAPTPAAQGEEQEFVGRQRSLQSLNPEISVLGDVLVQPVQQNVDEPAFIPREFEFSFISNLDPYSRAKIFLSNHNGGGEIIPFGEEEEHEGAAIGVEEGYLEWVGLPAGFGIKLGRFYQQFGQLNRWHSHALPFQSRSLPHLTFIGEEPLAQTGASVHWLLPVGGGAGTYEATFEVTASSNEALFGEDHGVSLLGHVNGFWVLSDAADLDLGLSWIHGDFRNDESAGGRDLLGAEVAFTWRPPERATYRGFTLRGGVMVLNGLVSGQAPPGPDPLELLDERAFGYWTAGELRVGRSWLVGARFDRTENPENTDETAWLVSPTLTWWQSEFVRVRAEYDLLGRSFLDTDEGRLLLQVTFAMGPHKHENY